jgi:hypothetical protein
VNSTAPVVDNTPRHRRHGIRNRSISLCMWRSSASEARWLRGFLGKPSMPDATVDVSNSDKYCYSTTRTSPSRMRIMDRYSLTDFYSEPQRVMCWRRGPICGLAAHLRWRELEVSIW